MIKTLFIGTSEFAIPILESLVESENFEVIGIVTQPDKPVGRKQEIGMPALKKFAIETYPNIPIEQPEKIRKSANEILEKYKPELIIVASYGQIIPKSILDYPKYKCLNFHVSLLPDLRGAVPMPMAILKGYKKTGVTLQIMAEALDEGDILATGEIEIADDVTTEDLIEQASEIAAEMAQTELEDWTQGKITPKKQDNSKATYCYMSDIAKDKAEITFETPIDVAERMIRAFYPWPIAYINFKSQISNSNEGKGMMLKIYKARVKSRAETGAKELAFIRDGKSLVLVLQDGTLELEEVQLEGKKRDFAKNYLYLAELSR